MALFDLFRSNPAAFAAAVFVFSLLVGSFLNVVILRLPRMLEAEWRRQCQELNGEQPGTEAERLVPDRGGYGGPGVLR